MNKIKLCKLCKKTVTFYSTNWKINYILLKTCTILLRAQGIRRRHCLCIGFCRCLDNNTEYQKKGLSMKLQQLKRLIYSRLRILECRSPLLTLSGYQDSFIVLIISSPVSLLNPFLTCFAL